MTFLAPFYDLGDLLIFFRFPQLIQTSLFPIQARLFNCCLLIFLIYLALCTFLPPSQAFTIPNLKRSHSDMTGSDDPSTASHPYLSHLVSLLSAFEAPGDSPPPEYTGPTDWIIDAIEKGVRDLANRSIRAESVLNVALRAPSNFSLSNAIAHSSSNHNTRSRSSDTAPLAKRRNVAPDEISLPGNGHIEGGIIPGAGVLDRLSPMLAEDLDPLALHGAQGSLSLSDSPRPTSGLSAPNLLPIAGVCPSCGKALYLDSVLAGATLNDSGMSAIEELKLLKAQVQDVARVCRAVAAGDLSQKITVPVQGVLMVQLKDVINTMVERLGQFAREVTRVSIEVGTEGKLGGQAVVADVEGTWRELTAVVNKLAENLTIQVRSIAEVTMAVARGDLSREIVVEAKGEILELKTTVNNMVRIKVAPPSIFRSG